MPVAGLPHEPDDLPSFTRTTGGTITTFLPKRPPGSTPKPERPAPDARFSAETTDIGFADSYSSPTTDLPAGTWSFGPAPVGEAYDELATDVLPAGGFPIEQLRAVPEPSESRQPRESKPSAPHTADDRYESDSELDALLADLSAAVSPFLPDEEPPELPATQPPSHAPSAFTPAEPAGATAPARPTPRRQSTPLARSAPTAPARPADGAPQTGAAPVERLTDYPTPRSASGPSILGDGYSSTAAVRRTPGRPPVANLPLGPPRDYQHPMDGSIGGWIRLAAILLAVGLAAGAVSYAILS